MITNKHNLPENLLSLIVKRPKTRSRISVTDLIKPPMIRHLEIEHSDEIESDISDYLFMILGSAAHSVMERVATVNDFSEEKLTCEVDGITISGITDILTGKIIRDYKVTSVWSVLSEHIDWECQLNSYAWMWCQHGFPIEKLEIHCILRDWSRRSAMKDRDYPQIPYVVIPINLWSEEKQLGYIKDRIKLHTSEPVECNSDDMWEKPESWAVKKIGNKRATKVFGSKLDAELFSVEKGKQFCVEHRPSERMRCLNYCNVNSFCKKYEAYKNLLGEQDEKAS